jgi:hypothetical protein
VGTVGQLVYNETKSRFPHPIAVAECRETEAMFHNRGVLLGFAVFLMRNKKTLTAGPERR